MRMAYQKSVHGKVREVNGLTVGAERKSGIDKEASFSG
jgi:hypothetical protein